MAVHKMVLRACAPEDYNSPKWSILPAWLAFDDELTPAELRLLMIIGWHQQGGACSLSMRQVAKAFGKGHGAFVRRLQSLEARGYVYTEKGTLAHNGNTAKDIYLSLKPREGFVMPQMADLTGELDADDEDPIEELPGEAQPRDHGRADAGTHAAFLRVIEGGSEGSNEVTAPVTIRSHHKNDPRERKEGKGKSETSEDVASPPGEVAEATSGTAARGEPSAPSSAPTRPQAPQSGGMSRALRQWCANAHPGVDLDDAWKAYKRHHERRSGQVPSGMGGDALFKGWVARRAALQDAKRAKAPHRAPINTMMMSAEELTRRRELLRAQIEPNSPRAKNLHRAMLQFYRAIGPGAWESLFATSRWRVEGTRVVVKMCAKTAFTRQLAADRYGQDLRVAVLHAFGKGRTWELIE